MRVKFHVPIALVAMLLAFSLGRTTVGASGGNTPPDHDIASSSVAGQAAPLPSPEQFFGFKPGTDGELARYPKILEYFQLIAKSTDRVKYEELGKTTMGNSYALLRISSPQNLARFDRLVEINRRLADPRGLSDAEAQKLAAEGKPFYLVYATIHSTEVSNGQAIITIVHRLATENTPQIREILESAVVLMVPSQNPDGQHLVIDHWYKTKGTNFNRVYPDLYHKYVGHDDNRDWFMFTQKETRMNVELVQNRYKPIITHDMHQQGNTSSRIFVPPFTDPFDVNIHPILSQGQATVGQAMATALIAEGKEGVAWHDAYDMWAPARQYMVYHGQPRILTEIAGGNLADPFVNPQKGKPLGPQESRWSFPVPYSKDTWTLGQQVDYGVVVALAGMQHVAKYGREWLYNFYRVHRDWVNYDKGPYAFVVPATQRDPFATYEMLDLLKFGDVEINRATAAFSAAGKQYAAGSWVIKTAQPYGAFAKTMLEKQNYPDLRLFPGGPPEPPYDVTGQTLWMLMGVTVDAIDKPFDAPLELLKTIAPVATQMPARPKGAYLVGPESYGVFKMVAELQKANVPTYRVAKSFESGGQTFAPGTFVIPPVPAAQKIVENAAKQLGLPVYATDRAPAVDGFRLKPGTRVGLYRGANNMPGGWMMWILEQYGINYKVVTAQDFQDLPAKFDVILMPDGITRQRIVNGLDQKRNDPAAVFQIEALRTFPLCYEGDNQQRLVPQRTMGWCPPFVDRDVIDVYCRLPYTLKFNRSMFRKTVTAISPRLGEITDANTGASPGSSAAWEWVRSTQLRLGRAAKRLTGVPVNEESWPEWKVYLEHSHTLADQWKRPNPIAADLYHRVLGRWSDNDFETAKRQQPFLFLGLLTVKLWLDQRAA